MSDPEGQRAAYDIFSGWIRLAHAGARRRSAVAFREAADMQDLWRSLGRAWGYTT